mgnify:FL=1
MEEFRHWIQKTKACVELSQEKKKKKARRERRTSAGISAAKGRTKVLNPQLNVAGDLVT